MSLVQKGLQYHELESSIDKVCSRDTQQHAVLASPSVAHKSGRKHLNFRLQDGNPATFTPSHYFFGPEPFDLKALQTRRDEVSTDQSVAPETRDRVTNGHPAEKPGKKNRLSETNGAEPMGIDTEVESKGSPIPNQVDGDGDVSMGPEEVPQEPTLTTGTSVGVQISPAKTADLSPGTARLQEDDHVLNAAWRPRDPTVLATAGDNFCSLWKLSLSSPPVQNRFLDLKSSNGYVSAVAWDAVGAKLAVASMRDLKGTITMYNADGNVVDMLPDLPRIISGLHWAQNSPQLIVVASDERTSELALWDDNRRPDVYPPPQVITSHVYDLAWCGTDQVFACGNGAVYHCEVGHNIRLVKTYASSDADAAWTFIRCTHADTHPVAVAAESSKSMIWIPTHDILIENAHQDVITAIDVRPQSPAQRRASTITVASYSTDSTVNLWQVDLESKQYKRIHRLRLGSSLPALAGSFSPDGYALGAASKDRLFIWNAERGGDPVAIWTASGSGEVKEEPDHANGQNGHAEPMPDHALSWDLDGKKLAYGFGNQVCGYFVQLTSHDTDPRQVAIVNLQR